ncbi:MAG TPA: GNAT family N-acetyltransferase [Acidimicrobiales bacterium]|jgi:GNAT superfamily N-acetyltransferase
MPIRAPGPEDAEAIAGNHHRGWQIGYRGLIADELLDGLDLDERIERWRSAVVNPAMTVRVVDDGTAVRGHVTVGAATRNGTTDGEVLSLYVDPDHWGRGYGRLLLRTGADLLYALGYTHLGLWMVEGNVRAQALYESEGYVLEGIREPMVLNGVDYGVDELKLHRR